MSMRSIQEQTDTARHHARLTLQKAHVLRVSTETLAEHGVVGVPTKTLCEMKQLRTDILTIGMHVNMVSTMLNQFIEDIETLQGK